MDVSVGDVEVILSPRYLYKLQLSLILEICFTYPGLVTLILQEIDHFILLLIIIIIITYLTIKLSDVLFPAESPRNATVSHYKEEKK